MAVQRSFNHKTMVTVLVVFLSLFAEIIIKESSFTLSGVKILHVCIDHSIKTSTVLLRGTIGF